jgi:hypothetical protein
MNNTSNRRYVMKTEKCAFTYAGNAGDGTPIYNRCNSRVAYVTSGHDGCFTRLLTQRGEVVGVGLATATDDLMHAFNLSDDLYLNNGEKL